MNSSQFTPLVEVLRGEVVESAHDGIVVVCDNQGNTLFNCGDPKTTTFMRSTAKPLQVLALLESQIKPGFGFTLEEIAVMCASHSGTDRHVEILKGLQEKIGVNESDLQCGIHPPFDRKTADRVTKGEIELTPLRHNCSGKHSGMLALAHLLGAEQTKYLDVDGPTQQLILKTCGEMFSLPPEEFKMGTDGCSAPVFAVPMKNAALAYARLCEPDEFSDERVSACKRITKAMSSHPYLVAGPKRIDTALMEAAPGKLIAKTGAEGFFGVGILPNALYPKSPGLGIMVKIRDGDLKERARPVILIEILKHLGLLGEKEWAGLKEFGSRPIANWRSIPIGEIRPAKDLSDALTAWKIL